MVRYVLIALGAIASAVVAAKAVTRLDEARRPPAPALAAEPLVARIDRARDGHYWANGEVDGRPVRFLVDTGATAVSLTPEDARRVGIEPGGLDYDYQVVTAQGPARAAKVKLNRVSVGGVAVDGVEALVIEKGLPASLLGMSYLGRLSAFEASPQALELRP